MAKGKRRMKGEELHHVFKLQFLNQNGQKANGKKRSPNPAPSLCSFGLLLPILGLRASGNVKTQELAQWMGSVGLLSVLSFEPTLLVGALPHSMSAGGEPGQGPGDHGAPGTPRGPREPPGTGGPVLLV